MILKWSYNDAFVNHAWPEKDIAQPNLTRNHMCQPKRAMHICFIVCIDVHYTDILFKWKVWVRPRLARTHTNTRAANIHTTHKGARRAREQKYRWGRRLCLSIFKWTWLGPQWSSDFEIDPCDGLELYAYGGLQGLKRPCGSWELSA